MMKYPMRFGLFGVGSCLLLACVAPVTDPVAVEAPPPELTALPLPEAELPSADARDSVAPSVQARRALEPTPKPRTFLPGLAASSDTEEPNVKGSAASDSGVAAQGERDVPFESEVMKQRKRIQLGLEADRQEQEPVDNIINLGF